MPWNVTVRYEGDYEDTPSWRMSTRHEIDPIEAVKSVIDKININRGGKHFTILSFSVERQP